MRNILSRQTIVLLAGFGAALTLAACDSAASVAGPDAGRKSVQPNARHDDADSAKCLSGYLDASGRWVCG